MMLFLLAAILLYAVPHLALFVWIQRLLPPSPLIRIAVLLFLLALMAAFYAGFALYRLDHPAGRFLLPVAFLWMAFVFWAFCAGTAVELWNLAARTLPLPLPPLAPMKRLLLMGAVCALAFLGSVWEAHTLRIRRVTLPLLSPTAAALRIAHLSDLHLGGLSPRRHRQRLTETLVALQPDLLLSSGDFTDAPVARIEPDLAAFAALNPPLGKYGVLGNHEFYQGLDQAIAAHTRAGFRLLRGEWVEIAPSLIVAGVDDRDGHRLGHGAATDEGHAIPETSDGRAVVLLLKHRPSVSPAAAQRADLQLSGHTHGGQIFPFGVFVRLFNPRLAGWFRISSRLRLYVSRGVGFWGPPLRLLAPPEITLIELVPRPASVSLSPIPPEQETLQ